MEKKEERIRALTRLYYSNPKVQEAIISFSQNREVIPRYFEGFGKRPDTLIYPSDIINLVNKGATSFHASEELWSDPFKINADMNPEELNNLRISWDLLIDIDSPFLDCSKIAASLIVEALESFGIKNYGIKFSGSKGFHIIISGIAFPEEFEGKKRNEMFPEWPRAISEFLMHHIRQDYYREVGKISSESDVEKRTNIKKEDLKVTQCLNCGRHAKKGKITVLKCPICGFEIRRKDLIPTKRRLKCLNSSCAGVFEKIEEKDYYFCEYCKDFDNEKISLNSQKNPESFKEMRGINAEKIAKLDLVLVAPRHLFRMPYSLHEKTSLASVVLKKENISSFSPQDANPLKVNVIPFLLQNNPGEAKKLLASALSWKKQYESQKEEIEKRVYSNIEIKIETSEIREEMFPKPIKKLLLGLKDGRKRGLFILITFLRSLGFAYEYTLKTIHEWNKKNEIPLKEGYIKSQIEWHYKQKKKILPPNYSNESFYLDLNLLDEKPAVKNPLVDVLRILGKNKSRK